MECVNPDCEQKGLLVSIKNNEKLPELCSHCRSQLQLSDIEKSKDATKALESSKENELRETTEQTEKSSEDDDNSTSEGNEECSDPEKTESINETEEELEGDESRSEEKSGPDHDQQQQMTHVESNNNNYTPTVPPSVDPTNEDCVTIVFHALLSPDFHFKKEKHNIAIRAGHPELRLFEWNCVDIKLIRETKRHFLHVGGEMLLPKRLLHEKIPYKYVVCCTKEKKADCQWEYSEFDTGSRSEAIVNRCLELNSQDKEKDAILHQYDGVIYPDPHTHEDNSISEKFWKWWDKKKFLNNRKYSAKKFLPRWKGFTTKTAKCEQMTATEALEQVYAISECLTNVYLSGLPYDMVTVEGLEFEKILVNFLKPKFEHNAKISEKDLKNSVVRVDRLVSSLAITHLIAHYKLNLTYEQLKDILHCLVIQTNGSDGCDFDEIHKDFPEDMWSKLAESIIHLMKAAHQKFDNGSYPDIILAIPLVHFLRKDSKPFEKPEVTLPRTIKDWCCAEGLIQYNKTYPGQVYIE